MFRKKEEIKVVEVCNHIFKDISAEFLRKRPYSRHCDYGKKYDSGITCYYAIKQVCVVCNEVSLVQEWVEHSRRWIFDDLETT
jgi:hypothetical protein